ncbi:sterol carrier family protein [Nesterenkonia halobia]|uniref:Bacterial SCP orthologue domain-containing protein n=1 Tax=Nesterenkonia halobia TaxID=37922 RepID=A0ABP6RB08_9MICC
MARRRITSARGRAAVRAWREAEDLAALDRRTLADAVRYLLEELAEVAPGNSVEVRVPPLGVTQCVEGPTHTRGTPPNVVELSPQVWLQLAAGGRAWEEALETGDVAASGVRADLSTVLPLMR